MTSQVLFERVGTLWRTTVGAWLSPLWERLAPVFSLIKTPLSWITPLGRAVILVGHICMLLSALFGWLEFGIIAAGCLTAVVLSYIFTIGRMRLAVTIEVHPRRVRVGRQAGARFELLNNTRLPVNSLLVELPAGVSSARTTVPTLLPGGSFEMSVELPTSRRGVIVVGPVRTQRGDPFGIIRREVSWTEPVELIVRPVTVPLESVSTGLLRDLEGLTTQEVSNSDMAFHALREYVPGDDQRHIHWKSSAKASARSGETKLLVRQFLDSRRSHLVMVTDTDSAAYDSDREFEVALSVGASIAQRTITDEMGLSIICGNLAAFRPDPYIALDIFARAALDGKPLRDAFVRISTLAPDVSVVAVATGRNISFDDLMHCRASVPAAVRMVVVIVDSDAELGLREVAGFTVLTITGLDDLQHGLIGAGV
ncbi:MAG: DUF58 domain-containing protein [Propionibacteriaceae bacterium]|nr:DUF58 domain-containing protein [Propionibacteriaceae bacterium]